MRLRNRWPDLLLTVKTSPSLNSYLLGFSEKALKSNPPFLREFALAPDYGSDSLSIH